MGQPVVWTEKNNCQDCYKCLRECTVKAIKIEEASASIIDDLCISCGHCTQICPAGAKRSRNDVPRLQRMLNSGRKLIVSLAPSYVTEFTDCSPEQLIAAFRMAGFFGVSETAIGAQKAAADTRRWLESQDHGVYLGSSCPAAVDFVAKYYPSFTSRIAPIHSPMLTHGTMLKAFYGSDVEVIFVGPCVAKKTETDRYSDTVSLAITFSNMRRFFDDIGIDPSELEVGADDRFIPHRSDLGDLFPIDGGMLMNLQKQVSVTDIAHMSFSGITEVKDILEDLGNLPQDRRLFIELMICKGGCIQGPARLNRESLATKRLKIIATHAQKSHEEPLAAFVEQTQDLPNVRSYDHIKPVFSCLFGEDDLMQALRSLNKFCDKDELNCGGCGYDNCRKFAMALLNGYAERAMCVAYVRGVAQDKASVLLQKIPSGVLMVDDTLKVMDANEKLAELLGDDVKMLYELTPGLSGADLRKLIDFHKLFEAVLTSGQDLMEQDVRSGSHYFNVSIVSIQKYRIVCGFIQNMHEPEVRREMVLNRTREVITENMKVVQQIAYLLGENASFTETMLNSLLDSHQNTEE